MKWKATDYNQLPKSFDLGDICVNHSADNSGCCSADICPLNKYHWVTILDNCILNCRKEKKNKEKEKEKHRMKKCMCIYKYKDLCVKFIRK